MALSTIGSIANHVAESFSLPTGISGNMIETVNMARIDVQNYTGQTIGSSSIDEQYQSPIVNLSKAQALEMAFSWAATIHASGASNSTITGDSTGDLSLAELKIGGTNTQDVQALSAISSLSKDAPMMFRKMADETLKSIGRKTRFARSLS